MKKENKKTMTCEVIGQLPSAVTGPVRNTCTCGRVHKASREADVFGVQKQSARKRKAAARMVFMANWRRIEVA